MGIKVDNIYKVPSTLVGREYAFSKSCFLFIRIIITDIVNVSVLQIPIYIHTLLKRKFSYKYMRTC